MFFFSSRRRHTRSKRDWSSDVCSSDLWATDARIEPASRPRAAGNDPCRDPVPPRAAASPPKQRPHAPARGGAAAEIGRASCRERVEISVVGGAVKEKEAEYGGGRCS